MFDFHSEKKKSYIRMKIIVLAQNDLTTLEWMKCWTYPEYLIQK